MVGLTSVFHIFALLSLLGMTWWMVRWANQLKFIKRIWKYSRSHYPKAIWVDWPHRFVEQFCQVCGADFELVKRSSKPCRISPKAWLDLDREARIVKVRFDNRNLDICVERDLSKAQLVAALDDLERAFADQFFVNLVFSPAEKP